MSKHAAKRKNMPLWAVVLLDLLLIGATLLVFALFHHVLPLSGGGEGVVLSRPTETPAPTAALTSEPAVTAEPTPEPTPTPDPNSWAVKFAEHFTEETVVTDTSYTSPNISVTVTQYESGEEYMHRVWFVADIYVTDIEYLQTYLYGGEYTKQIGDALEMAESSGSAACINGDYAIWQYGGLVVRNGVLYKNEYADAPVCIIYYDGEMECMPYAELDFAAAEERGIWQAWTFGPVLVRDGEAAQDGTAIADGVSGEHPRTALGYFEPGHYCFLVCDGRQAPYSRGMTKDIMAQTFLELGCVEAFNMDGGASSQMVLNGAMVNKPYNGGRDLSDIILVRDPFAPNGTEEEAEG